MKRFALRELENRITPAFTPAITGSPGSLVITETGGAGNDLLRIYHDPVTDRLFHDTYDIGLVSGLDFDMAPGEQAVFAKDVQSFNVIGNAGTDIAIFYAAPVGGSLNVEDVRWFASNEPTKNADIVVVNSKLTVTDVPSPKTFALTDAKYLWLGGYDMPDGDNTFDVSGFTTGYSTILSGAGGNDTLIGSPLQDWFMPGPGANIVVGNGGGDLIQSESGLDTLTGGPGPGDRLYADNISTATFSNTSCTINGITTANGFETISLKGTPGNDFFDLSAMTNYTVINIEGLDGNDTILGGTSAANSVYNYLYGGNGNDVIVGGPGVDYLDGGADNDTVTAGAGADFVTISGGSDTVDLGTEFDTLSITNANTCYASATQVTLNGLISTVAGGGENLQIIGTPGNDTLDASSYPRGVSIYAQAGDDVATGTSFADGFYGDDGNDTFDGGAGDDSFYGAAGNDTYLGGDGDDYFSFDATADSALGGAGRDTIVSEGSTSLVVTNTQITINGTVRSATGIEYVYWTGTTGADTFDASTYTNGNVNAIGGDGNDILRGPSGNTAESKTYYDDLLQGGNGNDTIYSGANNTLGGTRSLGGSGDDIIYGNVNSDNIDGGDGNDTIYDLTPNTNGTGNSYNGGYGNDTITIAAGNNTVIGSNDTDTLTINATAGNDAITVANGTVTINGLVTTYATIENLTIDAGAGLDTATQSGTSHPIAYKINGLEPAVSAGPDVTTLLPVTRSGSFADLGAGQTWTGQVSSNGGAWQPLAINSTTKTFTVTTNFSGVGSFVTSVKITDNQGNAGVGSFTTIRRPGTNMTVGPTASIPTVATAYFHDAMSFDAPFYSLQRISPGPVVTLSATPTFSTANGGSKVSFAMSGLTDGLYRFTLFADRIHDSQGAALDGNGDGTVGDDHIFEFHRLFGDVDGNRTVDAADFSFFPKFGAAVNSPFDFEGNGTIDATDFAQFGNRFGVSL